MCINLSTYPSYLGGFNGTYSIRIYQDLQKICFKISNFKQGQVWEIVKFQNFDVFFISKFKHSNFKFEIVQIWQVWTWSHLVERLVTVHIFFIL